MKKIKIGNKYFRSLAGSVALIIIISACGWLLYGIGILGRPLFSYLAPYNLEDGYSTFERFMTGALVIIILGGSAMVGVIFCLISKKLGNRLFNNLRDTHV